MIEVIATMTIRCLTETARKPIGQAYQEAEDEMDKKLADFMVHSELHRDSALKTTTSSHSCL